MTGSWLSPMGVGSEMTEYSLVPRVFGTEIPRTGRTATLTALQGLDHSRSIEVAIYDGFKIVLGLGCVDYLSLPLHIRSSVYTYI